MNDHLGNLARSARGEGPVLVPAGRPVFIPAVEPFVGHHEGKAAHSPVTGIPERDRRRRGREVQPQPTAVLATSEPGHGLDSPGHQWHERRAWPSLLEAPQAQPPPEVSPPQTPPGASQFHPQRAALLGSEPEPPAGPADQSVSQTSQPGEPAVLDDTVSPQAQTMNAADPPLPGPREQRLSPNSAQVREQIAPALPLLAGEPSSRAADRDSGDPVVASDGDRLAAAPDPGRTTHAAGPERPEQQPARRRPPEPAPTRPPATTAMVTGIRRELSAPTASGKSPAADPVMAQTIHVSIGRIEVRAVQPPARPPQPEPPRPRTSALSLEDYLRGRDRRNSG